MRITVLAGGIGGARFVRGLLHHLRDRDAAAPGSAPSTVTVVGNTGDDIRLFGLQVCPDLDTVMYTLGGGISYTFPTNTAIAAGAFRVIAKNPARLATVYSLTATNVFGPYSGYLGNDSDTVRLQDAAGNTIKSGSRSANFSLANLTQANMWLGHSEWPDNDANASYDEVRIWNAALTESQLQANSVLGPDALQATFSSAAALPNNASVAISAGAALNLVGAPQTGDIIVFQSITVKDLDLIKRVMGLPGDHIVIGNGKVSVNGQTLNEPYTAAAPDYSGEWQVPNGCLFVLGDNRNDSSDSHVWGFLPIQNVIGKALLIYWPPTEWAMVDHIKIEVPTP